MNTPTCPCGDPNPQHSHEVPRVYDDGKAHPPAAAVKYGKFVIKDSGKREEFTGGMLRDTEEGKIDYLLALDGPMFKRYAEHLTKGAKKYGKRNWLKGVGQLEYSRARSSAFRHLMQWLDGETDEDHAAAVIFNVNQAEYLKTKNPNLVDTPID